MDATAKARCVEPEGIDLDVLLRRMSPETFPDAIDFGLAVGGEVDDDTRLGVP